MSFSWTEFFGFVTGAAAVWLLAKQKIWNWPIGIANAVFYIAVFLRSGLYGDAGLQVVYALMNAYGWYSWLRPRRDMELKVQRTPGREWGWMVPATGVAAVGLARFLATYTDSTVPWWDGLTTSLSLVAIYGQSRKFLESWWIWILADLIYIPLYGYKGLWLTSVLYVVFLGLCVVGLRDWTKALRYSTG
jgi:nicotinamide mononucleotide transporter